MFAKRAVIAAIFSIAGGALGANAADLRPILKAPALLPVPAWTGFYLGGHLGYGWGKKEWYDIFPTRDLELDAAPTVRGGLGGLQVGYNHQFNRIVLGVEGDFTWADVGAKFDCFTFGNQKCSSEAQWFATIAGRLGVLVGPALIYAKGGGAWVRDAHEDVATTGEWRQGVFSFPGVTFRGEETRAGWMVGGGVEYAFLPNWTVKVEYNYMDFGKRDVWLFDGSGLAFPEEIHQKINVVKAGVNYRFGWGAPVGVSALGYAPSDGLFTKGPKLTSDDDESPGRVIAFTGLDVGKKSVGGWAGAMIALSKDLDTSGPRVMIMGGAGTYKYPIDGGGSIRGTYSTGEFLAGWGFEGDNYSINLLGGLYAANHMLSEFDPENIVQGTAFGPKVRADAWINPTPQTLVYGEAEYSTAFHTYHTSAKFGYDFTNAKQVFVGPEVAVMGDERYEQWRVGGHVTQIKLGRVQFDVAAGYAHDSVVGNGAYGRVELSTNF